MPENGAGSVTVSVTLDRSTGKVSMRGPKDKAAAYALLKAGLDMLVGNLMNPGPERKVKTLDELGVSVDRRVR